VAELFPRNLLTLAVAEPHAPAPTTAQEPAVALATCVACVRSGRQRCRIHARRGRRGGVWHARRHLGIGRLVRRFSAGGAAVVAGVACLAARTWHSRLQKARHRPQRSSLPPLLPHALHEDGDIDESVLQVVWLACWLEFVELYFK